MNPDATERNAPMPDSDIDEIRALIERTRDAWNRGDGAAYGACFTADASDVTYYGTVYRGSREIGRAHQALFDSVLKGTRLTVDILEIRRYGGDAAVVLTRGESSKGTPRKLGKLVTYTVVRDRTGWSIAAVQKTQHRTVLERLTHRMQPSARPSASDGLGRR